VGVERIVLEHHRNVTIFGFDIVDDALTDRQVARRDLLEAGDHAKCRGLATARRADKNKKLGVLDLQIEVMNGMEAVRIHLVDLVERDGCHGSPSDVAGRRKHP